MCRHIYQDTMKYRWNYTGSLDILVDKEINSVLSNQLFYKKDNYRDSFFGVIQQKV